jgi:hypothetical protein
MGNDSCFEFDPEDRGSVDLWNIDILPQCYTAP